MKGSWALPGGPENVRPDTSGGSYTHWPLQGKPRHLTAGSAQAGGTPAGEFFLPTCLVLKVKIVYGKEVLDRSLEGLQRPKESK